MSFILDALKKSQRTRQRDAGPATVSVETAGRQVQPHNWWAMVIAIVVLNLIVMAGFAWYITREQRAAVPASAPTELAAESVQARNETGAVTDRPKANSDGYATGRQAASNNTQEVGTSRDVRPLSAEVRTTPAQQTGAQPNDPTPAAARELPPKPASTAVILPSEAEEAGYLPTLAELQLDQRVQLSPLHVDVHVYNENPRRRFVLINTTKYKEGERLKEGPLLEEIRTDGLVMYYRGERFLVPRN